MSADLSAKQTRLDIAIATGRQAHYRLPANSFLRRQYGVSLYTATPASRLRGFDAGMDVRWVPAPVVILSALTHSRTPLVLDEFDSTLFDHGVARRLSRCDVFLGASTSSLASGRSAKKGGAVFVLDRACPDIRVQQDMLVEEAKKVEGTFQRSSPWFLDRQIQEYEEADFILAPSHYSGRSYPEALQSKIILAPLCGRTRVFASKPRSADSTFVLGAAGGGALRKGYLYLLEAWKRLALPNAQLKIRTDKDIFSFPRLKRLIGTQKNVEIIGYVPDIRDFYAACDAYIQPSVDDGFGMSLFEAMGAGLPSIATRNCGASELLEAGTDLLLIDAFSIEQIEASVLQLYESRETRERLQHAGLQAIQRSEKDGVSPPYEAGIDDLLLKIAQRRS
jgi:glycosyltransferase involved in cell wall biosynthesis